MKKEVKIIMADERKKIFIETVENLFNSYPLSVPSEALEFFEDYQKSNSVAKEMTEKGYNLLQELKEVNDWITAKSLGERLDISGRSVSGTMRKLVSDGFVEKQAGNPASYRVTEKGMNYNMNIE
jgi:predicted transcriptional regulator